MQDFLAKGTACPPLSGCKEGILWVKISDQEEANDAVENTSAAPLPDCIVGCSYKICGNRHSKDPKL